MLKSSKKLLQGEIDPVFAKRAEFILKAVEKEKPSKILDVGCGRGFYVNALSKYPFVKKVYGVDVSSSYISIAKKTKNSKANFIKASIYKLPFKDKEFDLVICSEVLEHLKKEYAGLREIRRVLKHGGILLITVPNENFPFLWDPINWILTKAFNTHVNKDIWFLAGIWAGHERLYKEENLKELIESSKFKILNLSKIINCSWPFSHFLLYGLGKNIVERFPVKGVSRFDESKSAVSIFLANFFAYPTKIKFKSKSAVNLLLKATKV